MNIAEDQRQRSFHALFASFIPGMYALKCK
jgi:hypothetical protein